MVRGKFASHVTNRVMDDARSQLQEAVQVSAGVRLPTDLELVAQILRKDRKATAQFVTLYADQIYGYVQWRLIPRLDLVDDLVQEIFLAAWENLSKFRGDSSLQSWMLGIARHKVENHYRNCLREVQFPECEEDREFEPVDSRGFEETLDRQEAQKQVREILAKLPEPYSFVLLWRYWEKRSLHDIAVAIGKTEKAIERLLARARNQFRKKWNERNVVPR
jgi:RNA polymerase sigma-70 factor, ECF subfamily